MSFRLVDKNWREELLQAAQADRSQLRIICPFIKTDAAKSLISNRTMAIKIITRFNLADFAQGVSDTKALRWILSKGGHVRGVKNLHAKVFIFGAGRVIVTSANLTTAALTRNHEFGFVSESPEIVENAIGYFDALWKRSGQNLTLSRVDTWEKKIEAYLASGAPIARPTHLGDDGASAGFLGDVPELVPWLDDRRQAFVKFLGDASNRVYQDYSVIEELKRSDCHWALAYPEKKRPTGVQDGALMLIARLTKDPKDIRVFGRAIGMKYVAGRDDASPADVAKHYWKAQWPRYIRVHHAEFVAGTMANGISLNELMGALRSNSFSATQRNAAKGSGNTDPRRAYNQQAAVQLSSQGLRWLNWRLEKAFLQHGKVPAKELDNLGWPTLPKSY